MLTRKSVARGLTYTLMALWVLGFLLIWMLHLSPSKFGLIMGPLAFVIGLTNLIFHNEEAEIYNERMQRHSWMQWLGPSSYSGISFIIPAIGFMLFGIFITLGSLSHP